MLPPKRTLVRYEGLGTARFLTFSCFRRHPLFDDDRLKDRFVEHLVRAASKSGVAVFAWVVMPEHVHLLVTLDGVTADSFLRALKPAFSKEVLTRWRDERSPLLPRLRDRTGTHHFWQKGGGYDRNLVGDELVEKIDYCHRNPIKRGLCAEATDWRWSSARAYEFCSDAIGPKIAFDRFPRT